MKKKIIMMAVLLCLPVMLMSYTLPEKMDYPVEEVGFGQYPMHFYPIGIAQGRYFAFALHKDMSDGVGPMNYLEVVIQDLVSDKIVEYWSYNGMPENDDVKSFRQLWQEHKIEIESLLQRHGIGEVQMELKSFPLSWNGSKYQVYGQRIDKDDPELPWQSLESVSLYAHKDGLRKRIYHEKSPAFTDFSVVGAVTWPGVSRMAVIMIVYSYAFEGSMDVSPVVIGCHLEKGYK